MTTEFKELSPNQEAALHAPCRKCGRDNSVLRRTGRFGPWVECGACGDKVRRPRGVHVPPAVPAIPATPAKYEADAPESIQWVTEPVPAPAPTARKGTIEAAILDIVRPEIDAAVQRANDSSDTALTAAEMVESLQATVKAELDKLVAAQPVVVEVRRPDGVKVTREGAHYLHPRIVALLGAGFNLYLWGPAGSGKTTLAMQAAKDLGLASEIDTLDPSTFRSMVQGFVSATGSPVQTSFTRCWQGDADATTGKAYIADETDNAPGHVQTLFNSALANGHAPLAWGNVERGASFLFIGTGNTPGQPTRDFPDRRPMSAAFKDRLYFVHVGIDGNIERRAAGLPLSTRTNIMPHTTCGPKAWVSWVQAVRVWAATNMPTLQVTPRASLQGIKALALGESVADVADGLVFRGADAEMKAKMLQAYPLPVGGE